MELVIKQDLAKLLPAEIEFNYEELRSQLTEFVVKYRDKTITPEMVKEGKADCAGLNRLKDAFEEARKREKQKCLAPYMGFEQKVKELVGIVESARANIDSQLKAFESARKEAKAASIQQVFDETAADIAPLVPLERIFDPKWLNAGTAESAWRKELDEKVANIREGLKAVGDVIPEAYRKEAQAKFIETFNFPAVFSYVETRKKQDELLEARRKAEQEQAKPQPEQHPEEPQSDPYTDPQQQTEPVFEYTLKFRGTRAQLLALRDYMRENGIWYAKVG